jgi:metal-dependent amidase/aminoacylase/carboxypeptidase family protein
LLLFQSAEETGKGARGVLDSEILNQFNIEWAFALHNMPGYEPGSVICRSGNFTPAVESLCIELHGKTSHAGEPEKGINPAKVVSGIIDFFDQINEPDPASSAYFLATPIQIQMGGEAFGTSAGEAQIKYTFRAWENAFFISRKREIEQKIVEICHQESDLKWHFSWREPFTANRNHPESFEIIKQTAIENNFTFIEKKEPLTWGEDFGLFTEKYKGAMFGLGAGIDHPALHNPEYDFPDTLISPGIRMYIGIINTILND